MAAEEAGIELSQRAGRHGVPVAHLVPTVDGQELVVTNTGEAVSVWTWVDGRAVTEDAADAGGCGRVALLQLLGSLYGVKQHYPEPGLLQDDLDAFWLLRHRAARALLDHLNETDSMLADLASLRTSSTGQ